MKVEKMDVDVTPENTNYCYVLRAGDTSTKLPEHDNCNFPDFQKEFEGNGDWTIVAGVKGRIQEVSFPLNVQIPGIERRNLTHNIHLLIEHLQLNISKHSLSTSETQRH